MFQFNRRLGRGVTSVQIERADEAVHSRLNCILTDFYGDNGGESYAPHINDGFLRREVLGISYFDDFRGYVERFMRNGEVVVVIEKLHQGNRSTAQRNAFVFAIGMALGYPTPSDRKVSNVLWDVRPKKGVTSDSLTFSGQMTNADLHTDSQFFPIPERLTMFYSVQCAQCGGGVSKFCSSDELIAALSATPEGAESYDFLRENDVPFQIYDPYFSDSHNLRDGVDTLVFLGRVFGSDGSIRYRREVIDHGLRSKKVALPSNLQCSLREISACLEKRIRPVEHLLATDSLAICDNFRVLHGRSAFSDPNRHLIRVRMAKDPVAETVSMQRLELRRLRTASEVFSARDTYDRR